MQLEVKFYNSTEGIRDLFKQDVYDAFKYDCLWQNPSKVAKAMGSIFLGNFNGKDLDFQLKYRLSQNCCALVINNLQGHFLISRNVSSMLEWKQNLSKIQKLTEVQKGNS